VFQIQYPLFRLIPAHSPTNDLISWAFLRVGDPNSGRPFALFLLPLPQHSCKGKCAEQSSKGECRQRHGDRPTGTSRSTQIPSHVFPSKQRFIRKIFAGVITFGFCRARNSVEGHHPSEPSRRRQLIGCAATVSP
jgi:hypothetical protein